MAKVKIIKLVCVMSDGSIGFPCGACREYLMQLDENSGNMQILFNLDDLKAVPLKELLPNWWGANQFI